MRLLSVFDGITSCSVVRFLITSYTEYDDDDDDFVSECRYADIYTSRVSNFLHYTPFMYFRSQEQVSSSTNGYYSFWYCFILTFGTVFSLVSTKTF